MRKITIGKNGDQPFVIDSEMVSRRHAELIVADDGTITVRDLGSTNGTFVKLKNGEFRRIEKCKVKSGATLRLGPDYQVRVADLLQAPKVNKVSETNSQPEEVDITALRYLSEHYNKNKLILEQKSSTNGLLRMIVPMITVAGSVFGYIFGSSTESSFAKILPPLFILPLGSILFAYIYLQNKKILTKRNELDYNFKKNYCCPNCHYSFGNQIYENILLGGTCPKCKSKFTEKTTQQ